MKNFAAILCLSILALTVRNTFAAPVNGRIYELQQPDGTTVSVRIWGDEFYQVVESLEGYTLIRDHLDGEICYARASSNGNELLSTRISARHSAHARDNYGRYISSNIPRHARLNRAAAHAKARAARARLAPDYAPSSSGTSSSSSYASGPQPSTQGDVKAICLIIDFPDESGTIPPAQIGNFCNLPGYDGWYNNGSVFDYFYEVSDGALRYTNYVPPVYYTAQNTKSYYDNPAEDCGPKARELIQEALNGLNNQGFDFSQYDSNHDGYIDGINCFYAGSTGSGWAKGLWPHSWTVSFSADGVSAYKYQITDMGSSLEFGTFCHENGHMICFWPDLYDYDYDSTGVGDYCLMGYGAHDRNPVEPCAYLKYIAGWADVTALNVPQTNLSLTARVNSFYMYQNPARSNEYHMMANRQKSDRDWYLPDSGLAIWHIDTSASNNNNNQRTCASHFQVTLVQADGLWDLENNRDYGDSTDLFDASYKPSCSPTTNPNTDWWCDGSSGLTIYNIGTGATTMYFSFDTIYTNNPPIAVSDTFTTEQNQTLTISAPGVMSNDSDPDNNSLTAVLISPTTNGSLTLNSNGSFTYVPDSGYLGTDSFTYCADDGAEPSNIATVNITIDPIDLNGYVVQNPTVIEGSLSGSYNSTRITDGVKQSITEASAGRAGMSSLTVEYTLNTQAVPDEIVDCAVHLVHTWTNDEALKIMIWKGSTWQDITADMQDDYFIPAVPQDYFDTNGRLFLRFEDSASARKEKKDVLAIDRLCAEISADPMETDLAVTNLTVAPTSVQKGESVNGTVTIQNLGVNTISGIFIDLLVDGSKFSDLWVSELTSGSSTTPLPFTWDSTNEGLGSHIISAELNIPSDQNSANDSANASVQVTGPQTNISVANITMSMRTVRKSTYQATAIVTLDKAIPNAAVYATWSGAGSGSSTAVTNNSGKVTFDSNTRRLKNGGTFTITITNVIGDNLNFASNENTTISITVP